MDAIDYSENEYIRPPKREEIVLTPEDFSSAVKEDLRSNETLGYSLGEPFLFDDTIWLQICMLDPQKEVPSEILLYTQEKGLFPSMREVIQAKKEEFRYRYDSQSDSYYFDLIDNKVLKCYQGEKSLFGNFDRAGKIDNVVLK